MENNIYQEKLQDFKTRILESDYNAIGDNVLILANYINSKSIFQHIFYELKSESEAEIDKIDKTLSDITFPFMFDGLNELNLSLKGKMIFRFDLISLFRISSQEPSYSVYKNFIIPHFAAFEDGNEDGKLKIAEFSKIYIFPLIEFLIDEIDEINYSLDLLIKYKRKREWFNRSQFFKLWEEGQRTEDFLDMDLRCFLFENGIDYPFSKAHSPSGESDIIANLDSYDPLIIEVKFLDATKNYGLDRITSGFAQAIKYAGDFNKSTAYLVIFNANEKDTEIEIFNADNEFPVKINIGNKTVFIITINFNPKGKSASKIGKLEVIKIEKSMLINSQK
ncbi:MAG: hypothetical protein KDE26_07185 [Bacteroidetes bacterium]|nr:hypothetical protein [Bacteroidota bacterium]